MRSSTILAVLGAALAVATPVDHDKLHKKAIVYDIVTDIVYVTVTETHGRPPPSPSSSTTVHVQTTVIVNPVEASSTSSVVEPDQPKEPTYAPPPPPPPPPPTTSSMPPAGPVTTSEAPLPTIEPAPIDTTVQAPVEVPTTTAPAVEIPATTPAPVVESPATTPAKAVEPSSVAPVSSNPLSSAGVGNHNTCRSKHSASNVAWNETLASYAAKTAATCVFAHDMSEGGGGYGQNIASQGSSSSDAWTLESALENAIIQEWYSEASMFTNLYGQESPSGGGDWLHFTQVVWKNSFDIGCAVQACPTSNKIFPGMYTWFTVCNYYPQGNVLGEFAQNVSPS